MIDDLTRSVLEQRDNIENQRNRELNSNREHYIKQLEQENKQLKEKIKTYEDPEDMTLMYMWCNEKAKDKIKQLKEVIEEVRELINFYETTEWGLRGYSILQKFREVLDKAKDVR